MLKTFIFFLSSRENYNKCNTKNDVDDDGDIDDNNYKDIDVMNGLVDVGDRGELILGLHGGPQLTSGSFIIPRV